ncbi:hypothetical protein [Paenibacillus sp. LHD-38]|uniref:hypothetical protein n=1 Tax=Paenibacillus sp. LHD-38 TaxID=3072143 RepID=UPI00280E4345|nr:hypothetical protein [Paenibacillus sp. LHD-38]MDQ8734221.1 hypothetical protein [Paenibacillus sp. LHD-38]
MATFFKVKPKWIITVLFIAFTWSLSINWLNHQTLVKHTEEVLERYSLSLVTTQQALNSSVNGDPKTSDQYLNTAREYLAIAIETAVLLGKMDGKYHLNNQGDIYQTVPYELRWLLNDAINSKDKEKSLQIANEAFVIFSKNFDSTTLKDPDSFRIQYLNTRAQWQSLNLKEAGLSLPS